MVADFESYRNMRLKQNAYDYAESVTDEDNLCCPTCNGAAFKISPESIECLFCGEAVELTKEEW